MVYDRGERRLILGNGYVTFDAATETPSYHFYLRDHLGNNRVVIARDGTVEQVTHYYPFGGLMRESTNPAVQPYKYGGKELDRTSGLDAYDFGARTYFADRLQWGQMDPLCEKYYDWSPYNYCVNNPVGVYDKYGTDIWEISENGFVSQLNNKDNDIIYMLDERGNRIEENSLKYEYGTIQFSVQTNTEGIIYGLFTVKGDGKGKEIFELLSENSSVEWSHAMLGEEGKEGVNYLTTSHRNMVEYGMADIMEKNEVLPLRSMSHSHPNNTPYPSDSKVDNVVSGDIQQAGSIWKYYGNSVIFSVYLPREHNYVPYTPMSKRSDFHLSGYFTPEFTISKKK